MATRDQLLPLVGLLVMTACGGGGGSTPTAPATPTVTNTITITSQGVSPKDIQITAGSRVTFRNNDTRNHNMTSDPHPDHTDCPELNQVGLLTPGRAIESGNLNTARVCKFHDHDNPGATSLTGTVTIR
jgi:plastocyanin